MLFLHEFDRIEAEAFLTLAGELAQEDSIVTQGEDSLMDEFARVLGITGFTFDATAVAAARNTMAMLNEVSKRKVYMEMYAFAIVDGYESPSEQRTLSELRDALMLDEHICKKLEKCVDELYGVYQTIEDVLGAAPSPISIAN